MKHEAFLLSACLVSASFIPAQYQTSLLFTTLGREFTLSTLPPTSLERIIPEDVMVVTPIPGLGATSEKFAPHKGWLTLVGDEDNNQSYWEAVLASKIDAVFARMTAAGTSPNMRETYISPAVTIGGSVSTTGALRPGDVARVDLNGQFRFFLRENQVRSAFGIPAPMLINVDAVTFDGKLVYLSFEKDQKIQIKIGSALVWTYVRDGAIVAIPTAGFGEPVLGVTPNSGIIVAREIEVDKMVDNSQVRNRLGVHPTTINDLDGLAMDPNGGSFKTKSGGYRNLIFCGETLTGGGVLSTAYYGVDFGKIANLNGMPLANTVGATTGVQVGLRPWTAGTPTSLNGLETGYLINHFVLETMIPVLTGGSGTLSVDIGGADPGFAWLLLGFAPPLPPAAAAPSVSFWNTCFPDLYPFFIGIPVPINAQGYGSWNLAVTYGSSATIGVTFQGLTASSMGLKLSTPITIEAKP